MNMKNVLALSTAGLIIGFAGSVQAAPAPAPADVQFTGKVGNVCLIKDVKDGVLDNNPNSQLTISTEYPQGVRGSFTVKCNSGSTVTVAYDASKSDVQGQLVAVDFGNGGTDVLANAAGNSVSIGATNAAIAKVRATVSSANLNSPLPTGFYKVVATATITPQ